MEMPRVLVFDHLDNQVCELSPNDVFSLVRTEEINGQNSLEITCSRPLSKEQRVLVRDMMGVWREYVVAGVDESHLSGEHATGTYLCEWSLKHDLMGVTVIEKRPGVQAPVPAGVALGDLLSYTRRWSVGDVTVTSTGGRSLYWVSAWEGLGEIVDEWGGEARADIAVSPSGVVSRRLSLLEAMGEQAAKRRFDFGYDLTGIQRRVEEEPLYCRIYPRGKGEETDSGGYGRRVTIESANNGVAYIENEDTAQVARLPDGQGGYEYPSCVIENSEIDDPAALKAWAESVSDDYTTPKVTYTGTVEQFAAAGMSAKGVSLGDAVQCVDRGFAPGAALRVNGRVVRMVVDETDPSGANLTIGYVSGGLASLFGDLGKAVRNTALAVRAMNGGTMSTADYIERLIDRINAEINATGGYTYIKPGEGIWVYDKAEDQGPSQVVRIMGGSISIASAKTAQGEWKWTTLLTGRDGILAEAVTAARLTSGIISDASGKNYWNLDAGELHTGRGRIGGFTIGDTALFNGPSSLDGTDAGVYVGTDGVSSSSGTRRVALRDAALVGYQGDDECGRVTPSAAVRQLDDAGDDTGIVHRGIGIEGGALDIRTDIVGVQDRDDEYNRSLIALSEKVFRADLDAAAIAGKTLSVTIRRRVRRFIHGLLVRDEALSEGSITLAGKGYVDDGLAGKSDEGHGHSISDVSGLQSALDGKAASGHTHSGYASASHSHAYGSISGAPRFALDGTTLNITTT